MSRTFSDIYARFCQFTIESLQNRLGREATPEERRCIWNIGSLMMLESVERTFAEGTLANIEVTLRDMPKWTELNFQKAVTTFSAEFPALVGRPASTRERQALADVEHLGTLTYLQERLRAAPIGEREDVLAEWPIGEPWNCVYYAEAQISMLLRPLKPDGRHPNPPYIFAGYRCSNVYFERRWGANHLGTFFPLDVRHILPGETEAAQVTLLGTASFGARLRPGMRFEALEVGRLVATGVITAVLGVHVFTPR